MPSIGQIGLRRTAGFGALVTLLGLLAAAPAGAAPKYRCVAEIPLGSPTRWDYVHYDPGSHRVYVAHGTEITVVDVRKDRMVGRIRGIAGAHGIVTVPALGRGYADDGETGEVTVFQLSSLKPIGHIPADRDSDGEAYDPSRNILVVANGHAHDASLIDAVADKPLANVPLGGNPEGVVTNGAGKAYVNISSRNEIVRIDLATRSVDARWPTPGCQSPHGLAIDPKTRRLFSTCENGRMMVVDSGSGRILARLPIGYGTDSAAFDPKRGLAFSSNKDGTLSVIAEESPGRFLSLGNVPTAIGARTMAEDSKSGDVFLVTADVMGHLPTHKGVNVSRLQFRPGTVKLLIFAPTMDLSEMDLHQGWPRRSILW